jgi:hypothetical protein
MKSRNLGRAIQALQQKKSFAGCGILGILISETASDAFSEFAHLPDARL